MNENKKPTVQARRMCLWIFNNIRLSKLAPYVLGIAIGRKPRRVK